MYEFRNPVHFLQVKSFLLGDLMKVDIFAKSELLAELQSSRSSGPMHQPTMAAGAALFLGSLGWLAARATHTRVASYCVATGVGCAALTLSRHGGLALLVALPFALLGPRRKSASFSTASRIGGVVVLAALLVAVLGQAWAERIERRGSMLEDKNITARIIDGPARYGRAVSDDPMLLITGMGPGAHKARFVDDSKRLKYLGTASNGFLLVLLYEGVPGLLIFLAFWWKTTQAALALRPFMGWQGIAVVVLTFLVVLSDNYAIFGATSRVWAAVMGGLIGVYVSKAVPLATLRPARTAALAPGHPLPASS